MSIVRSCLSTVYLMQPLSILTSTVLNQVIFVDFCVPGTMYTSEDINDSFILCSNSTECDLSRPSKLGVEEIEGTNSHVERVDYGDLTSVDISNWNLIGERLFVDNNRLTSWGLQNITGLDTFKAASCSMPHLTPMVTSVIENNNLLNLDLSGNPLSCCQIGSLFPYPAQSFTPYSCISAQSNEIISISSNSSNPFIKGQCVCNDADKLSCNTNCVGHFYDEDNNRCIPCKAGTKCIDGVVKSCESGTFAFEGQESCRRCSLILSNCNTLGDCNATTGEAITCPEGSCRNGYHNSNQTDSCQEQTCLANSFDQTIVLEGRSFALGWDRNLTSFSAAQDQVPCPETFYGDVLAVCSASNGNIVSGNSLVIHFCSSCTPIKNCLSTNCTSDDDSKCTQCESNNFFLGNDGSCLECNDPNVTNCDTFECSDGGTHQTKTPQCIQCTSGFYLQESLQCQRCPENCLTCDSADVCTSCSNGTLSDNACLLANTQSSSSLSTGAIAGIVIAVVVCLVIALLLGGYVLVLHLRKKEEESLLKKRGAGILNANDMGIMTDDDWMQQERQSEGQL
eukprot:Awhi_evm1s13613